MLSMGHTLGGQGTAIKMAQSGHLLFMPALCITPQEACTSTQCQPALEKGLVDDHAFIALQLSAMKGASPCIHNICQEQQLLIKRLGVVQSPCAQDSFWLVTVCVTVCLCSCMLHTLLRKIASGASVVALLSGMLDGHCNSIDLGWLMQQLLRVGLHYSVALRLDCAFDAEGF